jgi:hypothetical protein
MGGWQIAGITTVDSGSAARIWATSTNFIFPDPGPVRPNQVGNARAGDQSGPQWFDPAAFQLPPAGEYGHAAVVPFRLPGRQQWDFSVSKNLSLVGTARLQIRTDFINAFNHTQFLDVSTYCFGATTCGPEPGKFTDFGAVTSARPPREIQLGIRLNW